MWEKVREKMSFAAIRHAGRSCFKLFVEKTFSFGISGQDKIKQFFHSY
jgi:hypothetical protein